MTDVLTIRVKARARSWFRAHPRSTALTAAGLRHVGLRRWADRVALSTEQVGATVVIELPAHARPGGSFLMRSLGGRDQIPRYIWSEGWHGFERPLPDVFSALAADASGVILDVGANTGFYSLLATAASRTAIVHAFEPYPPALEVLHENIAINRLEDRIEVFPVAVSDHVGEADLYVPPARHGLLETSCSLNRDFKGEVADTLKVPVVTLDEHARRSLVRPVEIIKVDVESTEADVLEGAEEVLSCFRPFVFFELLPLGDATRLEQIRQRHGYLSVRLRSTEAIVSAPIQFDEAAWNQVLVPEEGLDPLTRVCERLGLPLVTRATD